MAISLSAFLLGGLISAVLAGLVIGAALRHWRASLFWIGIACGLALAIWQYADMLNPS